MQSLSQLRALVDRLPARLTNLSVEQVQRKPSSSQWSLHRYQDREWSSLIAIWVGLNRQLLAAAEAVPDSAWSRTCTIADSAPLTLQFVFDDYVHHMLHHLRHMGVEVDDLPTASATAP